MAKKHKKIKRSFTRQKKTRKTSVPHGKSFQQNTLHQAIALHRAGNLSQAEALYRQILTVEPNSPDVFYFLGLIAAQKRKSPSAIELMKKALNLKPDFIDAHYSLGNALMEQGELEGAASCFRKALILKPDYVYAHYNLGYALMKLGKLEEAVSCFQKALALNPEYVDAYLNLGNALMEQGKLEEAVSCFRKALILKPEDFDIHYNLGTTLLKQGKPGEAVSCFRKALTLNPNYVYAHYNLGNALMKQGKPGEAVSCFRRALTLNPDFVLAHENLLMCFNYLPNLPITSYLDEARHYGYKAAAKVRARFSNWTCSINPERLLIGLVSGNLWNHPEGFFLENMLANIDPRQIDFVAYPTSHNEDELTDRIRSRFVAWKPLLGMKDEFAAQLIHNDGVHILLDLSGFTRHNRLSVFAWKPAPVQATWLGYWASTGIAEIDYIIADYVSVPESNQKHFTEKVWYLPETRFCFSPPVVGGELTTTSLPALQNGYITFGSFQNVLKINDEVLAVWGRIFKSLPQAKLRLQNIDFNSMEIRTQMQKRLAKNGIAPERVKLEKHVPREEYLAAHAHIDLILDTFPFSGGTTTCESLWMGVPTLSLVGETLIGRQGASIITCSGLSEWIAQNDEEYIAKAIAFASNIGKLAQLRAGLRQQVLASPLFDGPQFARNFEVAMWGMWNRFKNKQ